MRCLVFNLLVIASLVLLIAMAVLWKRSYRVNEGYGRDQNPKGRSYCNTGVVSNRGILMFYRSNLADHPDGWENLNDPMICGCSMSTGGADDPELWKKNVPFPQRALRSIGVTYGFLSGGDGQFWDEVVVVPDWLATTVLALLPMSWLFRQYRKPRVRHGGFCTACGYDLRATPERCPECGNIQAGV